MWKQQELGFLAHICAPTAPGLTYAMRMIKCFGEKLAKIPLRENRGKLVKRLAVACFLLVKRRGFGSYEI
jgi:hypothetical protein